MEKDKDQVPGQESSEQEQGKQLATETADENPKDQRPPEPPPPPSGGQEPGTQG